MLTENGRGWVAEVGDRIVGFAIGDLSRANVWALFVDPDFEGRGVGRSLHDMTVSWLFEAGADRIWLSTDPGTRAERFYEAAGWRLSRVENGEAYFELLRQDWLARSDDRNAPGKSLQRTPGRA
jgi:GNAT superfamily N-acetyltransferase